MTQEILTKDLQWLFGTTLNDVRNEDGTWSFTFCAPGAAQSTESRSGHVGSVATESPWRLVVPEKGLVVTSGDHGHFSPPVDAAHAAIEATYCRAVTSVEIRRATGDLVLTFGDGTQLEFLQLSSGYEAWRTRSAAGELFCCGGGALRFLDADENDPSRVTGGRNERGG